MSDRRATTSSGYRLEVLDPRGQWVAASASECGRSWGEGYLACRRETPGPVRATRLVRLRDGHVIAEAGERRDVSLGPIAGWPTWRQYVQGARWALAAATTVIERLRIRDEEDPAVARRLVEITAELEAMVRRET